MIVTHTYNKEMTVGEMLNFYPNIHFLNFLLIITREPERSFLVLDILGISEVKINDGNLCTQKYYVC